MTYDIDAIFKAYPDTVKTVDSEEGAFNDKGENISSTLDQNLIDAARATINAQIAANFYKDHRTGKAGITTDTIYLPLDEQLDMQYWDAVNGTTTWKDHISAVKVKYPKPSS